MSDRYKGAILSPTAPTVIPQSAGGVYTLSQQLQYQGQGVWPSAVNYPITKSLRFRSSASAYLNRTLGTPTNSKIWTYSGWVKRGSFASYGVLLSGGTSGSAYGEIYFDQPTSALIYFDNVSGATIVTSAVYRDPSAWYHVVVSVDTTQATASNRVKIYVNGVQVTAFSSATYPTQNANTGVNFSGYLAGISAIYAGSWVLFADQYLAEQYFIDGQALTPSSFGTTDAYGIWQPIRYSGTYGTNGFYLPFTNTTSTSTLGNDFSGNSNTWTVNNISLTSGSTYDSMTDVPTNTNSNTANYFVLNPLVAGTSSVLSNGNLTFTNSAGTGNQCTASMFVTSGSYYFEATLTTAGGGGTSQFVLVGDGNTSYSSNGQIYSGGVLQTTVATLTSGDVVGLAFTPGGSVTYYKNGTSVYTGGVGGVIPIVNGFSGTVWNINFGQQPFSYTAPSGFYPLNTYNLPTPTILDGDQYFNAVLWTGNGSTPRSFTGIGFAPDFAWIKSRSTAADNALIDSVRGTGSKALISNTTSAENGDGLVINSFDSDGYTLATGSINFSYANTNTASYVSWNWKANGTGVTNTQGTITSTVSANTTAGFSVVTYTGTGANATVGHGLGAAPSMVIIKNRTASGSWLTYHASIGNTGAVFLNLTNATITSSTYFNNTSPTSTVFSVGDATAGNGAGNSIVAYCFSAVAGYSAFGSYTGNGSSDGPFVYLGFRPRFVLIKASSNAAYWIIEDSSRNPSNVVNLELFPNDSTAETNASRSVDFLSNGFKLRHTDTTQNGSGYTYIYMAFAENPFKIANAR